ncbi:hypothetical protein [Azospirillum griseum]|jgi:hypothetical protein|uniref:Uncharacterized protein n=1 Tax=Azospirillum griseum TaxID=2496639 RepID=A0A3S0IHE8_9PROT|nr:hypothetical protein [Azospirillum griseum]RTR23053.1 hypothetical protein EJ903_05670 [Azospirillum griseum]
MSDYEFRGIIRNDDGEEIEVLNFTEAGKILALMRFAMNEKQESDYQDGAIVGSYCQHCDGGERRCRRSGEWEECPECCGSGHRYQTDDELLELAIRCCLATA